MSIVDGGTSYKYGAYLSNKSDSSTITAFDAFRVEAETMSGHKIQHLHTNQAYDFSAWSTYCHQHGIIHEFTVLCTDWISRMCNSYNNGQCLYLTS